MVYEGVSPAETQIQQPTRSVMQAAGVEQIQTQDSGYTALITHFILVAREETLPSDVLKETS